VKKSSLALLCLLLLVVVMPGLALSARFDSTVTVNYQFEFRKVPHNLTLAIPLKDYHDYKEKPRPAGFAGYSEMVTNPYVSCESYTYFSQYISMATGPEDDAIIDGITGQLKGMANTMGLNDLERLRLVMRFVQSLTYTEDMATTPYFIEYPRYPVETLFEQGGDCEDTSILAVALLTGMGYDTALLLFEGLNHIGLGANFPVGYGNSWIHEENRYWYFDTTGGQALGWCPAEYAQTSAWVFPVR